jgi:transposase
MRLADWWYNSGMKKPLFVRPLLDHEREQLEAGLRSQDAFVLRRSQIILSSARGLRAPAIAEWVGFDDESVRRVIKAFNERGLEVLQQGSRRPHHTQAAFSAQRAERLRELLHRSPRDFGKPTSVWTLELAAEVSFAEGLTATRVSDETIRATLLRLGVKWQRAKHWITSPDPEYQRKKTDVSG